MHTSYRPVSASRAAVAALVFQALLFIPSFAQAAGPSGPAPAPRGGMTAAAWREDLHFLADSLPRLHLNLFHDMTRAEFDAAVSRLDADIPSLDSVQVAVRLIQLCAMIQDGHSGMHPGASSAGWMRLPARFSRWPDGVFVQSAAPAHADAVGGRVISVGGVPIEEAVRRADSMMSHDPGNDGLQRALSVPVVFSDAGLLHGLGLAGPGGTAEFVVERNGRRSTLTLAAEPAMAGERGATPRGWVDARPASAPVPLSARHAAEPQWFTYVPERRALYFQFNSVANGDSVSLEEEAARLRRYLDTHDDVDRVVLDLRNNGGGNNTLLKPLLTTLIRSRQNRRGGLYELIGPMTFSAAQNFTNRLENTTDVIFVGAPTGQNVNFFGDTKRLTLPHSHLVAAASWLWWQDMDPRDHRRATVPDLALENTFADYVAGRDPALELALAAAPPATVEDALAPALGLGPDSLRARFEAWRHDPLRRYAQDPEAQMNNFGYRLLGSGRVAEAVAVLDLTARTHPDSWNAFDSLGESLAASGDTARAVQAYRRSLELNPSSESGKAAMHKLARGEK